jgi:hypothetical protein
MASIEGNAGPGQPGGRGEISIQRFESRSLRLATGGLVLELGHLVLHQLVGPLSFESGQPQLAALQAASAEVSGAKLQGPVDALPAGHAAGAFSLAPLAAADGTIRAEIVDAHLLFDADVTVPIRRGQIDFDDATVEHVGPDSRMGVSRLGLYVDAANGRSYLYQFAATPVAGVEFERRGALLGPWVSDRGKLVLQPFAEGLLGQPATAKGPGFTEQTRLLLDRTALAGELQLGDGPISAPGIRAELAGRAEGHNTLRLHSEAVGRGVTAAMASLRVRSVALEAMGARLECDELGGALTIRLLVEGGQLRLECEVADAKVSGLRLALRSADRAPTRPS